MTRKRVAFYAPMKPPTHPAPSGDRQMARLLMAALDRAGYDATLVSDVQTYLPDPEDTERHEKLLSAAKSERARLSATWQASEPPDLWVSYHPYYKSPDLLGPPLCRAHDIPWITVEASWSARRSVGLWEDFQNRALETIQGAAVNVTMTERDAIGLSEYDPNLRTAPMAPFIEATPFLAIQPSPEPNHLVAVAMMRRGDKLESYTMLAEALRTLSDIDWCLTIVGDGPARKDVLALFKEMPGRITWAGQMDPVGVRNVLCEGALLTWPGSGEAYGLTYIEAQAAGLPVIAQNTAGVPEVVTNGHAGLLTPTGDIGAYAAAIRSLLDDTGLRRRYAEQARQTVTARHTLDHAATTLKTILDRHVWGKHP